MRPRILPLLLGFGLLNCLGQPTLCSPKAAATMATIPDFKVEYLTLSGLEMSPELNEYESSLLVDGRSRVATFSSIRASGDDPGSPIGTFRVTLTDTELDQIYAAGIGLDPSKAPPPGGIGGLGLSSLTLRFQSPHRSWDHTLSSLDPSMLEFFDPLLEALSSFDGRLYETPEHALRLRIRQEGGRFVIDLENIGTSDLAVLDPRPLGATDPDAWAGMLVAEFPPETPGVTSAPLEWRRVALELPSTTASSTRSTIVLPAGKTVTWRVQPWTKTAPGRHIAQGVIMDYAGPDSIDNIPRIRGAVFSEGLEFTP